jgi:hypothetical protein
LALELEMLRAELVTVLCILICVRPLSELTQIKRKKTIPLNVTCQLLLMPSSIQKVAGFDSTITGWF